MTFTREALIHAVVAGARPDFLFFWGHTPKDPSTVDASCLSQWFPRAFEHAGSTYATAEHFMMAEKARTFRDATALEKILNSASPMEAKALGREVRNFDAATWANVRFDAVVRGNLAKFSSHEDLKSFLLGTQDKVLVEAAPRDTIWGIGLGRDNPRAQNPRTWRGLNLLGFALMSARAQMKNAGCD